MNEQTNTQTDVFNQASPTNLGKFQQKFSAKKRLKFVLLSALIALLLAIALGTNWYINTNSQESRSRASNGNDLVSFVLTPNLTADGLFDSEEIESYNLRLRTGNARISGASFTLDNTYVNSISWITTAGSNIIKWSSGDTAPSAQTLELLFYPPLNPNSNIFLGHVNLTIPTSLNPLNPSSHIVNLDHVLVAAVGQDNPILRSSRLHILTLRYKEEEGVPAIDDFPTEPDEGEPLASPTPTPTPVSSPGVVFSTPTPTATPLPALPTPANSLFRFHYSAASVVRDRVYVMAQLYGKGTFKIQVLNSAKQLLAESSVYNIDSLSTFQRYDFWFNKPAGLTQDEKIYVRTVSQDGTSAYTSDFLTKLFFL